MRGVRVDGPIPLSVMYEVQAVMLGDAADRPWQDVANALGQLLWEHKAWFLAHPGES